MLILLYKYLLIGCVKDHFGGEITCDQLDSNIPSIDCQLWRIGPYRRITQFHETG